MKIHISLLLLQIGYAIGSPDSDDRPKGDSYGKGAVPASSTCKVSRNCWNTPHFSYYGSGNSLEYVPENQPYGRFQPANVNINSFNNWDQSSKCRQSIRLIFGTNAAEGNSITVLGDDAEMLRNVIKVLKSVPGNLAVKLYEDRGGTYVEVGEVNTDYWSLLQCLGHNYYFYSKPSQYCPQIQGYSSRSYNKESDSFDEIKFDNYENNQRDENKFVENSEIKTPTENYTSRFDNNIVKTVGKDGDGNVDYFYADLQHQYRSEINENSLSTDLKNRYLRDNDQEIVEIDNSEKDRSVTCSQGIMNYFDTNFDNRENEESNKRLIPLSKQRYNTDLPKNTYCVNIPQYKSINNNNVWPVINPSYFEFKPYVVSDNVRPEKRETGDQNLKAFSDKPILYSNIEHILNNLQNTEEYINTTSVKYTDKYNNVVEPQTTFQYVNIPPWDISCNLHSFISKGSGIKSYSSYSQMPTSLSFKTNALENLDSEHSFYIQTPATLHSVEQTAQKASLLEPKSQNHEGKAYSSNLEAPTLPKTDLIESSSYDQIPLAQSFYPKKQSSNLQMPTKHDSDEPTAYCFDFKAPLSQNLAQSYNLQGPVTSIFAPFVSSYLETPISQVSKPSVENSNTQTPLSQRAHPMSYSLDFQMPISQTSMLQDSDTQAPVAQTFEAALQISKFQAPISHSLDPMVHTYCLQKPISQKKYDSAHNFNIQKPTLYSSGLQAPILRNSQPSEHSFNEEDSESQSFQHTAQSLKVQEPVSQSFQSIADSFNFQKPVLQSFDPIIESSYLGTPLSLSSEYLHPPMIESLYRNMMQTTQVMVEPTTISPQSMLQSDQSILQNGQNVLQSIQPLLQNVQPMLQSEQTMQSSQPKLPSCQPIYQSVQSAIQSDQPMLQSFKPTLQGSQFTFQSGLSASRGSQSVLQSRQSMLQNFEVVTQNGQPMPSNSQSMLQSGQPMSQRRQPILQNDQSMLQTFPQPEIQNHVPTSTDSLVTVPAFDKYQNSDRNTKHSDISLENVSSSCSFKSFDDCNHQNMLPKYFNNGFQPITQTYDLPIAIQTSKACQKKIQFTPTDVSSGSQTDQFIVPSQSPKLSQEITSEFVKHSDHTFNTQIPSQENSCMLAETSVLNVVPRHDLSSFTKLSPKIPTLLEVRPTLYDTAMLENQSRGSSQVTLSDTSATPEHSSNYQFASSNQPTLTYLEYQSTPSNPDVSLSSVDCAVPITESSHKTDITAYPSSFQKPDVQVCPGNYKPNHVGSLSIADRMYFDSSIQVNSLDTGKADVCPVKQGPEYTSPLYDKVFSPKSNSIHSELSGSTMPNEQISRKYSNICPCNLNLDHTSYIKPISGYGELIDREKELLLQPNTNISPNVWPVNAKTGFALKKYMDSVSPQYTILDVTPSITDSSYVCPLNQWTQSVSSSLKSNPDLIVPATSPVNTEARFYFNVRQNLEPLIPDFPPNLVLTIPHVCPVNPEPGYVCPLNVISDYVSSLQFTPKFNQPFNLRPDVNTEAGDVYPRSKKLELDSSYTTSLTSDTGYLNVVSRMPDVCPANSEPELICPLNSNTELFNSKLTPLSDFSNYVCPSNVIADSVTSDINILSYGSSVADSGICPKSGHFCPMNVIDPNTSHLQDYASNTRLDDFSNPYTYFNYNIAPTESPFSMAVTEKPSRKRSFSTSPFKLALEQVSYPPSDVTQTPTFLYQFMSPKKPVNLIYEVVYPENTLFESSNTRLSKVLPYSSSLLYNEDTYQYPSSSSDIKQSFIPITDSAHSESKSELTELVYPKTCPSLPLSSLSLLSYIHATSASSSTFDPKRADVLISITPALTDSVSSPLPYSSAYMLMPQKGFSVPSSFTRYSTRDLLSQTPISQSIPFTSAMLKTNLPFQSITPKQEISGQTQYDIIMPDGSGLAPFTTAAMPEPIALMQFNEITPCTKAATQDTNIPTQFTTGILDTNAPSQFSTAISETRKPTQFTTAVLKTRDLTQFTTEFPKDKDKNLFATPVLNKSSPGQFNTYMPEATVPTQFITAMPETRSMTPFHLSLPEINPSVFTTGVPETSRPTQFTMTLSKISSPFQFTTAMPEASDQTRLITGILEPITPNLLDNSITTASAETRDLTPSTTEISDTKGSTPFTAAMPEKSGTIQIDLSSPKTNPPDQFNATAIPDISSTIQFITTVPKTSGLTQFPSTLPETNYPAQFTTQFTTAMPEVIAPTQFLTSVPVYNGITQFNTAMLKIRGEKQSNFNTQLITTKPATKVPIQSHKAIPCTYVSTNLIEPNSNKNNAAQLGTASTKSIAPSQFMTAVPETNAPEQFTINIPEINQFTNDKTKTRSQTEFTSILPEVFSYQFTKDTPESVSLIEFMPDIFDQTQFTSALSEFNNFSAQFASETTGPTQFTSTERQIVFPTQFTQAVPETDVQSKIISESTILSPFTATIPETVVLTKFSYKPEKNCQKQFAVPKQKETQFKPENRNKTQFPSVLSENRPSAQFAKDMTETISPTQFMTETNDPRVTQYMTTMPETNDPQFPQYTTVMPETNGPMVAQYTTDMPETNGPTFAQYTTAIPETNCPTVTQYTTPMPETNGPTVAQYKIFMSETNIPTVAQYTTAMPETNGPTVAQYTTAMPETNGLTVAQYTTVIPETNGPTATQYTIVMPETNGQIGAQYTTAISETNYQTVTQCTTTIPEASHQTVALPKIHLPAHFITGMSETASLPTSLPNQLYTAMPYGSLPSRLSKTLKTSVPSQTMTIPQTSIPSPFITNPHVVLPSTFPSSFGTMATSDTFNFYQFTKMAANNIPSASTSPTTAVPQSIIPSIFGKLPEFTTDNTVPSAFTVMRDSNDLTAVPKMDTIDSDLPFFQNMPEEAAFYSVKTRPMEQIISQTAQKSLYYPKPLWYQSVNQGISHYSKPQSESSIVPAQSSVSWPYFTSFFEADSSKGMPLYASAAPYSYPLSSEPTLSSLKSTIENPYSNKIPEMMYPSIEEVSITPATNDPLLLSDLSSNSYYRAIPLISEDIKTSMPSMSKSLKIISNGSTYGAISSLSEPEHETYTSKPFNVGQFDKFSPISEINEETDNNPLAVRQNYSTILESKSPTYFIGSDLESSSPNFIFPLNRIVKKFGPSLTSAENIISWNIPSSSSLAKSSVFNSLFSRKTAQRQYRTDSSSNNFYLPCLSQPMTTSLSHSQDLSSCSMPFASATKDFEFPSFNEISTRCPQIEANYTQNQIPYNFNSDPFSTHNYISSTFSKITPSSDEDSPYPEAYNTGVKYNIPSSISPTSSSDALMKPVSLSLPDSSISPNSQHVLSDYSTPDLQKSYYYNPYDITKPKTMTNDQSNRLQDFNAISDRVSEEADLENILKNLPSTLKGKLQNYVDRNLENIKNALVNAKVNTADLGDICYGKYIPNTGVTYPTDNPRIWLKAWYSLNTVIKPTLIFKTEQRKTLNFIPIVEPKYIPYFKSPDSVQDIANEYITKHFSQPYVVKGVYSAEHPYAAINLCNTDRPSILWPTFCSCGCNKAGCRCQWK